MTERKFRADWCSRSQGAHCYQIIEDEKPVQNREESDSRTLKSDDPEQPQQTQNALYEAWIKIRELIIK